MLESSGVVVGERAKLTACPTPPPVMPWQEWKLDEWRYEGRVYLVDPDTMKASAALLQQPTPRPGTRAPAPRGPGTRRSPTWVTVAHQGLCITRSFLT